MAVKFFATSGPKIIRLEGLLLMFLGKYERGKAEKPLIGS